MKLTIKIGTICGDRFYKKNPPTRQQNRLKGIAIQYGLPPVKWRDVYNPQTKAYVLNNWYKFVEEK